MKVHTKQKKERNNNELSLNLMMSYHRHRSWGNRSSNTKTKWKTSIHQCTGAISFSKPTARLKDVTIKSTDACPCQHLIWLFELVYLQSYFLNTRKKRHAKNVWRQMKWPAEKCEKSPQRMHTQKCKLDVAIWILNCCHLL